MRHFLALALLVTACTDYFGDDTVDTTPDAHVIDVVYPCATWYAACAAARELAAARCDVILCDPLTTLTRVECVAREMESICAAYGIKTEQTCNGDYAGQAQLDACLADHSSDCNTTTFPACEL